MQIKKYTNADYLKFHKSSGIQVGDWVEITEKARSHERGWDNIWVPSFMDDSVGKKFEVIGDSKKNGFRLNDGWSLNYPAYILRKVTLEKKKKGNWHNLEVGQTWEPQFGSIRIIREIDSNDRDLTYQDKYSGQENTIYISSFLRWVKKYKAKCWANVGQMN